MGLVAFRGRSVAFANNGKGHGGFQFSEKVMVDFNFRRRPWRPSRKGGRSWWPSLIMGKGLAHRLDSPLWELRLDGPTGRTKLANHRQWKPLMIALGT